MIVFTDLTSLKQTGRELREAYAELDTFFYKASHDLRGPLASMMGVVAIGKSESVDPEIRRYFGMVETSVQRLDSTLLELIELARTRKGVSKLNSVAIDIVLDRVADSLRSLPRYGKVCFIRNVPEKRMIYTDPLLLQSVLQNLVHNAVNYSDREHPEVRIDVEEHTDEYEVRIADNGAGIPVQVRPRIFEMFYRGHLDSSGPGLGLFIVRNALEKMGGSIRFECPPDRGTVFYITLPKYLP
jgi:signal transduction histidine kinase